MTYTTRNVEMVSDINSSGSIYKSDLHEGVFFWIAEQDLPQCGNAFVRSLAKVSDEKPSEPVAREYTYGQWEFHCPVCDGIMRDIKVPLENGESLSKGSFLRTNKDLPKIWGGKCMCGYTY